MSDPIVPVLAIVPVRGGSRGIPRKWAQLVAGEPLLLRTLQTVQQAGVADRLVVSTEDPDIAAFCRLRGFEVVDRPAELADDDVPLADVVRQVVETLDWNGTVLVAQPTCPLLRPETVVGFVEQFGGTRLEWAISAAPVDRIVWNNGVCLMPRVNRQQLPTHIKAESGALQAMSSDYARVPSGRRGMIEIPAAEALDIDSHGDLAAARIALGRKKIEFLVVASVDKGSGHLWRCMQLSDALSHHDVWWSAVGLEAWALDIVRRRGWQAGHAPPWRKADLVVVDKLEVADVLVPHFKAKGSAVVVFEHDSPIVKWADLVVDEFADPKWTVLRPEFQNLPRKDVADVGTKVLVTFGGTDPAGLSGRVASMLAYGTDARVRVVQGPAAEPLGERVGLATVVTDASMAEEMCWADLVVTGQGRTVAEAVACGTPVVSVSQNERESRHARLPGVLYLGLWAAVSDEALLRTVSRLLDRPALRQEMVSTASTAVDGRGVQRIVHAIEGLLQNL